MSIPRCAYCNGSVLGSACILCARSAAPETVSLGDALATLATPDGEPNVGSRHPVPLSVSLERARRWGRGEPSV